MHYPSHISQSRFSVWHRLPLYAALYALWVLLLLWATQGFPPSQGWRDSWFHWDALWYERIWNQGYSQFDHKALAFPPGYPLLVGYLSLFTSHGFHAMAMMLNLVALFFSFVLAAELLARQFSVNRWAVFALALSCPPAYFAFPVYSDSLFCLMMWGALTLALATPKTPHAKQLTRAGEFILLLLIPWVRITGFAFAAWLVLRRWTALAVLISLVFWLALNHMIAGDAFYFLKTQQLFTMKEGHLFAGLYYTLDGITNIKLPGIDAGWQDYLEYHFLPLIYFAAFIACGLWCCRRKQWLLGATLLAVLFMSHNVYYWRSSVRYDLPLFPLLCLPLLCTKTMLRLAGAVCGLLALAQLLLQLYFANYFRIAQWAF